MSINNEKHIEVVEIFGQKALFTSLRIKKTERDKNLYYFDIRTDDDGRGDFATLEKFVLVNHGGTIITREPINLGPQGYIVFEEDTLPNFINEYTSIADFKKGNLSDKK